MNIQPIPLFPENDYIEDRIYADTIVIPMLNNTFGDKEVINDYNFVYDFISMYCNVRTTYTAYRGYLEKFLWWCWSIEGRTLKTMDKNCIQKLLTFMSNPPSEWVSHTNTERYYIYNGQYFDNPDWKLFKVFTTKQNDKEFKFSESSLAAILQGVSRLYRFGIQTSYLNSDPTVFIKKRKSAAKVEEMTDDMSHCFTTKQWKYIISTAEHLAESDPTRHERTLFITSMLYGLYLRISELVASDRCTPRMDHFYEDVQGNWWFKTIGKGDKFRKITVSNDLLSSLKRYRSSLGLSELPGSYDPTPLVVNQRVGGPITDTSSIRNIVYFVYKASMQRLEYDGLKNEAESLKHATVHWLRHTGISEDVKTRPLQHVRDDAGHSSLITTNRYIHVESQDRHESAKYKVIKPL